MNNDKYKLYMLRILKDVFNDPELSQILAFKGGTSLMFFYQLPRFSVDLDFNILDITRYCPKKCVSFSVPPPFC